jgi:subtilase family serine protease
MMPPRELSQKWKWLFGILFACSLFIGSSLQAQTEIQPPRITEISSDRGLAAPLRETELTVHLKLHNDAAFDKAIEDLYTPGSPTYHQWMTSKELARYGATADEVETVKKELESQGLSILGVASDNFSIRARGTMSNIQNAFQTQIHDFEREGQAFYSNVFPAKLTGAAGNLVHAVSGLSSFAMKPMIKYRVDPRTGKPIAGINTPKLGTPGFFDQNFTNKCFKSPAPVLLTRAGSSLPIGSYYGNLYAQGSKSCGWTPAQVMAHYGMDSASKNGLDGTGQTIVIVDGPSDSSVAADLATFSQLAGLPAPTSASFRIIYPDGKPSPYELKNISNWDDETTLDIEWAHGIAPKAKIVLLITPTQDWTEFEYAIQYATEHRLGNVISNSYGYPEFAWGAVTLRGFDQVLKKSAASGIAVNFSSGDSGDLGTGTPYGGGASYPSTSAYATQIGGTSIGIPDGNGGVTELGWGTNQALLSFTQDSVLDPPIAGGFVFGAGGGESMFIPKPSWQKSLPGTGREGPDISAVGDPFTGGIVVTGGLASAVGGTSLATPVFSAIWALADQKAGKSLGQAAPLIAKLPSTAITDILPSGSPTNPAGVVFDSNGSTYYSSDSLLAPLFATTGYFAALWDYPFSGGEYVDVSFGTDTSLTVTPGWDDVTGRGVPNGLLFINAAAKAK